MTKPSNVLVMDEPTNDLDIETLELLENCCQISRHAAVGKPRSRVRQQRRYQHPGARRPGPRQGAPAVTTIGSPATRETGGGETRARQGEAEGGDERAAASAVLCRAAGIGEPARPHRSPRSPTCGSASDDGRPGVLPTRARRNRQDERTPAIARRRVRPKPTAAGRLWKRSEERNGRASRKRRELGSASEEVGCICRTDFRIRPRRLDGLEIRPTISRTISSRRGPFRRPRDRRPPGEDAARSPL